MSISSTLRREGIEVISSLDALEINKIASIIADKLATAFPEQNLDSSKLFAAIAHLNMYIAKFPGNDAVAKYFYKNNSIYFSDKMDLEDLNTLAIHECIHFIQEIKNGSGKLLRMGLYKVKPANRGMAINEAAVQYMASVATNFEPDSVCYYGMNFFTNSTDYYPLQTALMNQLTYYTGTYPLVHSTLFSDDVFENTLIVKSSTDTVATIYDNFDFIVHLEEQLAAQTYKLANCDEKTSEKKIQKLHDKCEKARKLIYDATISTQNLIIHDFFSYEFSRIKDMEDVKNFQTRLYNFKNLLINSDDYEYYNEFYREMMNSLEEKRALIEKYGIIELEDETRELALIDQSNSALYFIKKLFIKIRLLIEEKIREKDF